MQADPFNVFPDLVSILLGHNGLVIFKNLVVLLEKALNVSIELMRLVEEALQDLHSQIFANLENVSILSNHFSQDGQICASCSILLQEVLENKIVLDFLFNVRSILISMCRLCCLMLG